MIELGLFMAHCVGCFGVMGIQWSRQSGVYPLLEQERNWQFVGLVLSRERFSVRVFMGLEALAGLALLAFPRWLASGFSSSMLLLLVIWALTFLVARPLVRKIQSTSDRKAVRRLVQAEWIRTVGWTMRACILILVALV